MHVCADNCAACGYGGAVSGDGPDAKGAWDVQAVARYAGIRRGALRGRPTAAHVLATATDIHLQVSYDASMADLQDSIQEHLSALLVDPSSVVKRAVLHNISLLCIFLGRQKTNDVLLSHMITYLNDRDWLLRYAFLTASLTSQRALAGGASRSTFFL